MLCDPTTAGAFADDPMTTLSLLVGTAAGFQLPAVVQLVETVPVQVFVAMFFSLKVLSKVLEGLLLGVAQKTQLYRENLAMRDCELLRVITMIGSEV
jgi:hypothetical protein